MKKLFYLLIICTVSLSAIGMQSCNNNKLYDFNTAEPVKGENHHVVEGGGMFSGNLSAKLDTSWGNRSVSFYKDGEPLPYDDEYGYDFDFLYFLSIYEFWPWSSDYNEKGLSKEGIEKCIVYLREAPFKDQVIVDGIDVTEWLNKAYYNAEGKKDDWNWVLPETRYGSTTFYARKLNFGMRPIIIIRRNSEGGVYLRPSSREEL